MTNATYEQMLEAAPDIYCVINRDGNFVHINRASARILGYQPEELAGRPFLDMVVTDDRKVTFSAFQTLLQGRPVADFTNHYYRKDGSIVTLIWSSNWDHEKQVVYGLAHDVMDKKLSLPPAQKSKHTQNKTLELYDCITDGYFTLDENWRFTYCNKPAGCILGDDNESFVNRSLWECFPSAIGTKVEQEYKRAVQQKIPVHFEFFYPEPFWKWFEISAYPSDTGLSVFFRDISERKRAEEEMARLSFIVKKTDNLVVLSDEDGKIKWVNDAFIQKTGYSFEEAVGKRPGDLLAGPETDTAAIEHAREQYLKGEPFQLEMLYYTKNKEKLLVEVTGQPVLDAEGNIKEIFSVQTDITKSRSLQEQLNKEREEYQQKLTAAVIQAQEQERSEIGKELHDNINQILTTVKLYLEVGLRSEMHRKELTIKSIKLLKDSINEIRCLSKRLSAPTITIGLVRLKESLKELVDYVAATNQFHVNFDATAVEELIVDEKLHLAIYRIVQEHLTNILKHANAHNVSILLDIEEANLVLKITDDGKGFDTSQKRKGIGISNMITRARSIGGTLTLRSQPGEGCELTASFSLEEN